MSQPVVDPWLVDDGFSRVDFSIRPEDALDPEDNSLDQYPGLSPEVTVAEGGVIVTPTPEPEPEGPETFQVEDGTVTLEKEKGQWKATLESGNGGQPQVYWGKNKNELLINAMKAQLNATKKIRDLNMKVKLGTVPAARPAPPAPPANKTLSADEIFEIKTQLDSNPDLALQTWFQKTTGLSVSQLVGLAQKGAQANAELETDAVGRSFMGRNPEYFASPQNLKSLIRWVGKFKLDNPSATLEDLYANGAFTVDNLEEAFQDLSTDGLLVKAPKPVALVTPEPTPQPRTDERIVRTETRTRAGLGIRTTDVTPAPPPAPPKPPSAEDLEAMTDEQIKQLYNGSRRFRATSRRSQ